MRLSDGLLNPTKKALVVDDCCNMIEAQVASKSGMGGIALKTAFATLKGIKPGYIPHVIGLLLPQWFEVVDPIWNEGIQQGDPAEYLVENCSRTADALLSITDAKIKESKRPIVRGTYDKFRNSAKQYVEQAVPDFAEVIDKYTKI